jgi:hypothetical protein
MFEAKFENIKNGFSQISRKLSEEMTLN